MNLNAVIRLINMKINRANKKAKNPFVGFNTNHFKQPIANTLVWVEVRDENNIRNDSNL